MPEFSVKVVPYTQEGSNVIGFARIYFEDCFIVNKDTIIAPTGNSYEEDLSLWTQAVRQELNDENRHFIVAVEEEIGNIIGFYNILCMKIS